MTTRERIIEATLRTLARDGLSRLTLEAVATEAGVSRQTVYRHFGGRDALVEATIMREESRLIDRVTAAAGVHDELRPAVEAAIIVALEAAREHPLLDRLLDAEPEALLPFLTGGRGPVLSAARPSIERLLRDRLEHLGEIDIRRIADALTRLIVSHAINPSDDPPSEVASGIADIVLNGITKEG